jgi:serine/threonine protein kinase/tetratricopeptide (TPR) repeat protein
MSQPLSLRELFETAIDLSPDAREMFLSRHCDAELRARVKRMLASDPKPDAALPCAPAGALADALVESGAAPVLPIGTRIGAFELIRLIGEGGSSTVFHARRSEHGVCQDVALKLLRRGLHSREAQHEFRRERQALAQLRHPGIARLIEGGVTEFGFAYIALELVHGTPITHHARTFRLDVAERLRLFLDVCRAVEAAHRALIVHRDLKPSNVMVDGDGAIKLLDFGIAKLLDGGDDMQTRLAAFTPAYASPEQRSGGLITTATDVYSLGVLLGELMTGERLNEHTTRTPSQCVSDTHDAGVLPGSVAATRRLLKGDLDNIVLKALHVDAAQRYASAGMLAQDIERLLDGRPVSAHPPSRWYRMRKFAGRHRGAVATAMLSLLAILAALGIALAQADSARRQAQAAREQAARADTLRQFLVGVFDHAEPDVNLGQTISAAQLLEHGQRELAADAAMPIGIRLDLLVLIARLYWDLGDYAQARPLLEQASAMVSRDDVADALRARTLAAIARIEADKREFDAAMQHAQRAQQIASRIGGAGIDAASDARRVVAESLLGKDDSAAAEPLLREALASDTRQYGASSQAVVDDSISLGAVLTELSRFDEAIPVLRDAARHARDLHGPVHSSVAHALQELSGALAYSGDYEAAERASREAAEVDAKVFGPQHNETLLARGNLYWALEKQGRYEEGLRGRIEMLPLLEQHATTRPETLAAAYTSIGQDHAKLGRLDDAEAALRKALDIWKSLQGSNDEWDSADPMLGLADALRWHGKYAQAEPLLRTAIEIERKHEPENSAWLNRDRATLGDFLRQQGRYDEALRETSAAAQARRDAKPDPLLCVLLAQLSMAQLDAGDTPAALATAMRSVALARTLFKPGQIGLGTPLYALARAELQGGHPAVAEPLLREAIAARSPPNPPGDVRVVEIEVTLVNALDALGRGDEARTLRERIDPPLATSSSPYAAILRRRLASTHSTQVAAKVR